MKDITINEIIKAACGCAEDGSAKTIVIAALQKINNNNPDEKPENLMEVSSIDAIINLKTIGAFSYLDVKFPSATHSDLSLFYRCFEQFYEKVNDNNPENILLPFLSIIPLELDGEYIINATNPIFWAVEPDYIGEAPRTLRFVFLPDDVQFIYSDLNKDEVDNLIAQIYSDADDSFEDVNENSINALEEFEDAQEERNYEFTDAKYDPSNGLSPFDFSSEGDE